MKLFKWKTSISPLLRKFLREFSAKSLLRKKGNKNEKRDFKLLRLQS